MCVCSFMMVTTRQFTKCVAKLGMPIAVAVKVVPTLGGLMTRPAFRRRAATRCKTGRNVKKAFITVGKEQTETR